MLIITLSVSMLAVWVAESAVLDPALYLGPSPPLVLTSDSIPPEELWLQPVEARTERVAREIAEKISTTESPAAETGRMFWPRFSVPQPTLGIHIPMTFSLSGSYGKPAISPTGVVGNAYTSITGVGSSISGFGSSLPSLLGKTGVSNVYGNYGRSALAGSSYGTYGLAPSVRVYGGDNTASWSGWGNGKWGHYGKG